MLAQQILMVNDSNINVDNQRLCKGECVIEKSFKFSFNFSALTDEDADWLQKMMFLICYCAFTLSLCYYGVTTTISTTHKPSSNHVKKTHTHTVHTQGSCTSNKHLKETKAYCSTYYPHVIIKCNTSRIAVIKNKTKVKKNKKLFIT